MSNKEKEKQRVLLIREGNAALNEGNIEMAARIFKAINHKSGLIRVGDCYYFEKQQPLRAYGYYRQANHQVMMEKIFDGFTFALKCWLWEEPEQQKPSEKNKTLPKQNSSVRGMP